MAGRVDGEHDALTGTPPDHNRWDWDPDYEEGYDDGFYHMGRPQHRGLLRSEAGRPLGPNESPSTNDSDFIIAGSEHDIQDNAENQAEEEAGYENDNNSSQGSSRGMTPAGRPCIVISLHTDDACSGQTLNWCRDVESVRIADAMTLFPSPCSSRVAPVVVFISVVFAGHLLPHTNPSEANKLAPDGLLLPVG